MVTTLIPSSIIGKVLVLVVGGNVIHLNHKVRLPVSGLYGPENKIKEFRDRNVFIECRVLGYRPETGELSLRLDQVTAIKKWFDLWYHANNDWSELITAKYIFIE